MYNDLKISLSINLQGSALTREGSKSSYKCNLSNKEVEELLSKHKGVRKWLKKTSEGYEIIHQDLTCNTVKQSIGMTKLAYDEFTKKEIPDWADPAAWAASGRATKVNMHCRRICSHVNGTSYSFKILED